MQRSSSSYSLPHSGAEEAGEAGEAGHGTTDDLEELRAKLDDIDHSLLKTLRERIECCQQIAHVKRESGISMMQPQRIGLVQQRAAEYADEHGMNPAFLRRFYELMIEETCRVENLIIDADLARE